MFFILTYLTVKMVVFAQRSILFRKHCFLQIEYDIQIVINNEKLHSLHLSIPPTLLFFFTNLCVYV